MNWFHQVNPKWLEARRKYLTASEVSKLIPFTATGRTRNIDEVTRKIWAAKQCEVTEENITSRGVMARGHLMEEFAIKALNSSGVLPVVLQHWDDALVYTSDGVACSPDALDYDQGNSGLIEYPGSDIEATFVAEIKAYSADKHYECGMFTDPAKLEERWQLATAMYAIPSIDRGALVFFNPGAEHPLFIVYYTRANLLTELKQIELTNAKYRIDTANFRAEADVTCPESTVIYCPTEEDIIIELEKRMADEAGCLNP